MAKNGQKRQTMTDREQAAIGFWACVVGALVLQLIVCLLVGGQLRMFRLLGTRVPLPPLWLFTVLDWVACALVGVVMGQTLFDRRIAEERRYRSGFFLVLGVTFGYFWYALFFGTGIFLLAFLFALLAFLALAVVVICLSRRPCGVLWCALSALLWYVYRMIFTLFCLFSV